MQGVPAAEDGHSAQLRPSAVLGLCIPCARVPLLQSPRDAAPEDLLAIALCEFVASSCEVAAAVAMKSSCRVLAAEGLLSSAVSVSPSSVYSVVVLGSVCS
jgi:hypothetical protein